MPKIDNEQVWGGHSKLRFYYLTRDDKINKTRIGLKDMSVINHLKTMEYRTYTIPAKYEYRPELVAYEFYDDTRLWWVLIDANNMRHPFKEFEAGKKIRIPNYSEVLALLT